jgi:acyl-coenzyme A synthetase/AMP-(fatty) acid ligase
MERFESAHGVPVGQAYGLIEAGLPCINTRTGGLPATSVGRPVPGYDVAVFADDGTLVPAGVSGEIGIRGEGLFSAYYAPWRLRQQLTRDGWFMTGDVGRFDAAGGLTLEGRKKAVIFVAGLKFFPEEVEACLNAFPGVEESRVVGRAHARLGQVPYAEIVAPGVDIEALRAHCARRLSAYKVPVDFARVDTVPRTPGGKILRRVDA